MKWLKKLFSRKTEGTFVEVHMDYGFLRIEAARTGDLPFTPCLHIIDLDPEKAAKRLKGKRFDWGAGVAEGYAPFSHWRHGLEINGFFVTTWAAVQKYLKAENNEPGE